MEGGRKPGREGGTERNKYLISSRGCSVHIYSKKQHEGEKKSDKRWEGVKKKGEGGRMDGRKDKRMDREAGFGEQES